VWNTSLAKKAIDHRNASLFERTAVFGIRVLDGLLRLRIDGLLIAQDDVAAFRIAAVGRLKAFLKSFGIIKLVECGIDDAAVFVGAIEQRCHAL
jgi:hypothetical protein